MDPHNPSADEHDTVTVDHHAMPRELGDRRHYSVWLIGLVTLAMIAALLLLLL